MSLIWLALDATMYDEPESVETVMSYGALMYRYAPSWWYTNPFAVPTVASATNLLYSTVIIDSGCAWVVPVESVFSDTVVLTPVLRLVMVKLYVLENAPAAT